MGTLKLPGNSFSITKYICHKMGYMAIASFFMSFKRAKTIVDHRTRIWRKPLKTHQCQWSIREKTFNGDGSVVAKPLKTIDSNGTLKKIITIRSL